MAVRIRMKKFGRKHRPFYRICAMDQRTARKGTVLEELGTYDPMIKETDARALLNGERIGYWLSVGAQPSVNVRVLIKKYGPEGTHVEAQKQALARLSAPRSIPDPGAPASLPKAKQAPAPPVAEAAPTEAAAAETTAEATASDDGAAAESTEAAVESASE